MQDSARMRSRKRNQVMVRIVAGMFIILLLNRFDILSLLFKNFPGQNQHAKVAWDQYESYRKEEPKYLLREMMARQRQDKQGPAHCEIPHLKNQLKVPLDKPTECVRHIPPLHSCSLAQELFGDPSVNHDHDTLCDGGKDYCTIKGLSREVSCDTSLCEDYLHLGVPNIDTGKYKWQGYTSSHDLELAIKKVILEPNSGFCLLYCGPDYEIFEDLNDLSEFSEPQILNLPPFIGTGLEEGMSAASEMGTGNKTLGHRTFINFNFVFIDSVSRHHFYRSLPQSVHMLNSFINHQGKRHNNLSVMDFELVQGMRSRTYENLQALFSGVVNPYEKPFGTLAMPDQSLKTEALLKPLKDIGYKTLWLEDLCPFWEWGLSKDLLVFNKGLNSKQILQKLKIALTKAGIDSIGNTLASCAILHSSGVPDPFHGPDKLCFNGRPQHSYMLDYLQLYQDTMQLENRPFFTFFETNVGHDDTGKRIQQLDTDLAEYLKFVSNLSNTLTVILSDHGNAYGSFLSQSDEGRLEIFQPFMFMIIPEAVRNFIGESKFMALLRNQQRLVNILDLHYTVTSLFDGLLQEYKKYHVKLSRDYSLLTSLSEFNKQFNLSRHGLLQEISSARSCSQIPRIMPNRCICKNYYNPSTSQALSVILANFVVGEINNRLQQQTVEFLRNGSHLRKGAEQSSTLLGGFRHCQRLMVDHLQNIQENNKSGSIKSYKMDLFVTAPAKDKTRPEIFFATVEVGYSSDTFLKLGSIERISLYAVYSTCADQGVDLSLCICDLNKTETHPVDKHGDTYIQDQVSDKSNTLEDIKGADIRKELLESVIDPNQNMTSKTLEISVNGVVCFYIVEQKNTAGVYFTGVSLCKNAFEVHVSWKATNLILAVDTVKIVFQPMDVTFLTAGVVQEVGKRWSFEIHVKTRSQ